MLKTNTYSKLCVYKTMIQNTFYGPIVFFCIHLEWNLWNCSAPLSQWALSVSHAFDLSQEILKLGYHYLEGQNCFTEQSQFWDGIAYIKPFNYIVKYIYSSKIWVKKSLCYQIDVWTLNQTFKSSSLSKWHKHYWRPNQQGPG